ncbi:hypothetical protein R1sor_000721 [Riccia sorocarpa]|uniref:Fungal lipase-type domain-containing protein n=1 Tax=Riccia sorocarpa TaxID=122646 RepID=A0ABD3GZX5_9MARC
MTKSSFPHFPCFVHAQTLLELEKSWDEKTQNTYQTSDVPMSSRFYLQDERKKKLQTFVQSSQFSQAHQRAERTDPDHCGAISGLSDDVVADDDKKLAYDDVTTIVKELIAKNPNAKLFVTGHSLGGPLANL